MAQADSGEHDATAFGLRCESSSHKLGGHAGAAVLWAAGLVVSSLGNAVICVDRTGLERWSRLFDGPGLSWVAAILGYYMIANVAQLMRAAPTLIASSLLSAFALFGWTYHLWLLRWPWLTGQVMPGMRLTVYGATLSSTLYGMPLVAFLELAACGLIMTQAVMGLIATARHRGLIPQADVPSRLRTFGIASALALFALEAFLVVGLSQGRF